MLRAKFGLGIPTTLMWEVKFVELTTFAAVVCSHTDCFGAFLQCHYVCFPSKRAASLKRIPTKKVVFQRMMSSKKTQPAIHREPGKPLELSFIYLEERKKKKSFHHLLLRLLERYATTFSTSTAKHFHMCASLITIRTDG